MFKGTAQNEKTDKKRSVAYFVYAATIFGVLLGALIYMGNRISKAVFKEERIDKGFFIATMPEKKADKPKKEKVVSKTPPKKAMQKKKKRSRKPRKKAKRERLNPVAVKSKSSILSLASEEPSPAASNPVFAVAQEAVPSDGLGGGDSTEDKDGNAAEDVIDMYRKVRWIQVTVKHKFRPDVPEQVVKQIVEGCRAQFWIDTRGVPRKVRLIKCPKTVLPQIKSALMKWRFHPVKGPGGKPTPATFELPVSL